MKILLISNLFPPDVLGGYEILCAQVGESLKGRGHDVSALTGRWPIHGTETDGASDSHGASFPVMRRLELTASFGLPPRHTRLRRWAVARENERITRSVLEDLNPDVVFLWSQRHLSTGAARGVEHLGYPQAYTVNDDHLLGLKPRPFSRKPRAALRYLADRTLFRGITTDALRLERCTVISEHVKGKVVRGGLKLAHARVIYQGIPLKAFPLKSRPGEIRSPIRILYAGRLVPEKGVETLVAAVGLATEELGAEGISLAFAGEGKPGYEVRLRKLASSSPATVEFLGKLSSDALGEAYRDHDVLVFPSEGDEAFGLTHLEAMASGLPVISTAEGGQGEFLRHEENALVFPRKDSAGLAAAIVRLAKDSRLALALAAEGRRTVETNFTLERYAVALENFLMETVEASRR